MHRFFMIHTIVGVHLKSTALNKDKTVRLCCLSFNNRFACGYCCIDNRIIRKISSQPKPVVVVGVIRVVFVTVSSFILCM